MIYHLFNTHYPIFSIFKSLGCPNGCGDGMSGSYGDHLRAKGHNCLQRLQRINPVLFRSYLRDIVRRMPVQETVDFLHAFLGFCVDPTTILQSSQTPGQGNLYSMVSCTSHNITLCYKIFQ
jgi:hypothetical protein